MAEAMGKVEGWVEKVAEQVGKVEKAVAVDSVVVTARAAETGVWEETAAAAR